VLFSGYRFSWGRVLEIVLGPDDYDADMAERYG
jgi:hypothetical protein